MDYKCMNPFEFTLPTKVIFGPGCVSSLVSEIEQIGGTKPLLITDPGIQKAGIVAMVTNILDDSGIEYSVFDGVEANPKDVNAEAAAKAARAAGADFLIAVGGGSPIDCAKAVGVLLAHDAEFIKPYEGKTAATLPNPPLITIPTTSGTGSELTFSSVITDTKNKYKMTVKSPYTAATTALCDPELTLSVPPAVTAATGVDALTHSIEGFTAVNSEPIGDAAALYSIELIAKSLVRAYQDGSDLEARSNMLMASMLGGISFSHSDVASVHCIAEALGSMYDLPHGTCNAIFLPYVMEYNMEYCVDHYARVASAMGLSFDSDEEGAAKAVAYVKQLTLDVDLPSFASLDPDPADFPALAEMAYHNGSNSSNPRPMEVADYEKLLDVVYKAGV
ncbi:MAG: iron-containing alcohol dehydrogenase [Bacillota bacterium]|nr:iron-containing alcohol dehydrogenase [Bacillota bacterium]